MKRTKKLQLVRSEWLTITRKLLADVGLAQHNLMLFQFYDDGRSPLETLEYFKSVENRRRNETVKYPDGTLATGPEPLPSLPPVTPNSE